MITVYAYHYGEYGEYGDYSSKIMIMREREREKESFIRNNLHNGRDRERVDGDELIVIMIMRDRERVDGW